MDLQEIVILEKNAYSTDIDPSCLNLVWYCQNTFPVLYQNMQLLTRNYKTNLFLRKTNIELKIIIIHLKLLVELRCPCLQGVPQNSYHFVVFKLLKDENIGKWNFNIPWIPRVISFPNYIDP